MDLVHSFVENPIKVAVGVLIVALFGVIALFRMPMQLTPEVQTPTITIETRWPGRSPQEIEKEIVLEQEEQLKSVEGVRKFTSESSDSLAKITLEFAVGQDMQEALVKVNSRLNQVPSYPEDADEPVVATSSSSDRPIAWFILAAKLPPEEQVLAFGARHPGLQPDLTKAVESGNKGLAVARLKQLARKCRALVEAFPPPPPESIPADVWAETLDEIASGRSTVYEERLDALVSSRVAEQLPSDLKPSERRKKAAELAAAEKQEWLARFGELCAAAVPEEIEPESWQALVAKHPALAQESAPSGDPGSPPGPVSMERLRNLAAAAPGIHQALPPDVDVGKQRKFAEDFIEARFERVSGVSNSNVIGGREIELQVVVDPQKLAHHKLTVLDLRGVIRQENQDTSAGDFDEGKRRYVVRVLGKYRRPAEIADQILKYENGKAIYVRDVAEVRLGYKKPDSVVRRFGDTSIAVNCIRETGANVLNVMDGLKEALEELNADVLASRGLELTQVYDETDYIYSSIGLVNQNIVFGGLLTVIVLLVFLRSGASTIVIALAIPTSIIGTFLMLNLMGRSLNVISLAGLAFAVGMLVDNAVVVLENIYRHWEQDRCQPWQAAVRGTQEVWGAVIASTLTTLAVFLPVVFVQQEAGQLFLDIALAISCAVFLSLIVSVTVIPTASSRLLSSGDDEPGVWQRIGEFFQQNLSGVDRFAAGFVSTVVAINAFFLASRLRRFALLTAVFLGCAGLTWLLWPKVEYLPNGNRNLVFGILLPPPGYNLDKLMSMGESVEGRLEPYFDPDIPKTDDYPEIGDFFFVARDRQVFMGVRAKDPTQAGKLVPLVQQVGMSNPGTFAIANQASLFERGLEGGRTIDVEITGPDLKRLTQLGGMVLGQVMNPDAGVFSAGVQARPVPSLDLTTPETHVIARPQQTAGSRLTREELGYTVNALIDGAYAADYDYEGDKIDLTIIGNEEFVRSTQDVRDLPIATPQGSLAPLSAVAEVRYRSGPEQINRRERQRAVTISVTPPPSVALEDALERIESKIVGPLRTSGQLDGGYRITLAGTADKLGDTWDALKWNVLLALLITYLLMAALFESWVYPLVIILTVPLGAVGGILGLRGLGMYLTALGGIPQPLDVLTMLGFVILIGTVVNNAILIVHQSLNYIREEGMRVRDAILLSVETRIRPIFMTTATTCLGLAPLVFFPGAGSELYRGLGSVVLGGLLVSTLMTLFIVPALFSLLVGWLEETEETPEQQHRSEEPERLPAAADEAAHDEEILGEGAEVDPREPEPARSRASLLDDEFDEREPDRDAYAPRGASSPK